jgi:hypothetical protein
LQTAKPLEICEVKMTEIVITRVEEQSGHRDLVLAGVMVLMATAVFNYLHNLFPVVASPGYSLLFIGLLSPYGGLMLHARPLSFKLAFVLVLATAVFLL